MSTPTSMGEFNERVHRNYAITGYGIDGVTNHFPCPFCGAAEWLVIKLIDYGLEDHEATCEECERTARIVTTRPGDIRQEFLFVSGPEQPDWLEPKMRTVEEAT